MRNIQKKVEHFVQVNGGSLFVIIEHYGNTPENPFITTDKNQALSFFQDIAIANGFRKIRENESLEKYHNEYYDTHLGKHKGMYPAFDNDSMIHYWEIKC